MSTLRLQAVLRPSPLLHNQPRQPSTVARMPLQSKLAPWPGATPSRRPLLPQRAPVMAPKVTGSRGMPPVRALGAQELSDLAQLLAIPAVSFGSLWWLMSRMNGNRPFRDMNQHRFNFLQEKPPRPQADTGVRFEDVAGIDELKEELQEIVTFLKNPAKFTKVGARVPQGCLLVGPPGTGKTLLARAVAGEANVPFFSMAASEFVEMFVGVGAARIRALFAQARKIAPAIIFIDELDAVGKTRGSGVSTNDEREQTINQLLTEMDGFSGNTGVVVMAATNRDDTLDPALLRPGRFDRQIYVDLPNLEGREKILQIHARGKTLANEVNLGNIAKRAAGFSGAQLENLMNEAAIFAVRRDGDQIEQRDLNDALRRVMAGVARQSKITPESKRLIAVHEAGHALMAELCEHADKVGSVSIVPRGKAGGLTFFEPNEQRAESGLYSRAFCLDRLVVALGGRAAEEAVFGPDEVTTGASADLTSATRLARAMVTEWGWNNIGPISAESEAGRTFYRQEGDALTNAIDSDIKRLVADALERAHKLVRQNFRTLNAIADVLCDKLEIEGDDLRAILPKP